MEIFGGTGRFFFFFEAGRGGCFFLPRRDGAVVFFSRSGTGRLVKEKSDCFFLRRDGAVVFFFEAGRDGVVVFFQRRDRTSRFFHLRFRQEPLGSTATRAMFSHACQPQRQQHLMCQMVLAAAALAAPAAAAAAAAAATVMGLLPLLLVVVGRHHYSAVGSSTRPSRPSVG